MIRPDPLFAPSYAEARRRFVAAASGRGARLEAHVNPCGRGLDGEALAADVAVFGPADARDVVMLHSGTHGVEGYCGSGLQQAVLAADGPLAPALRAGVRVVLLHAINPWGFSWRRRVTEDNVDLNRNLRDFSALDPRDPAYDEVHPLLLPEHWPPDEANRAAIAAYVAEHGAARWQWAVSHGQPSRPDGLFHCGRAPAWSNRTLRDVLRRHVRGAERLAWIDVHTGLGPCGHAEMIYGGRDAADDLARTRAVWGPQVTSVFEGTSASARVEGQVGNAAYDECPGTAFAGIGLEYGTLPMDAVIDALRFDHWVAARAPHDDALRAQARERMMAAFFVDTDDWKAAVIRQGVDAFARAVQGLRR